MSAGWLVYALVTGTLVAIGCWALEGLARTAKRPARWAWAVGLLAMAGAAVRSVTQPAAVRFSVDALTVTPAAATTSVSAPASRLLSVTAATLDDAANAMGRAMSAATQAVPAWLASGGVALWLAASVIMLGAIALVHLRLARARRGWPAAALHGHDVRIAPASGPAVVGTVQPFIVVPRWLLARSDDEQRLVLAHESEHVRAHDHLLLTAAWLTVAVVPWHPAAWWMLSRLRLAIELDCDARVLRRGVAAKAYGTLLIDLAGRCTGYTAGATALAEEGSHLERRLIAMTNRTSRHTPLRTGALLAAGLLAILAACEAKVPTSAEVERMDVSGVEKAAVGSGLADKVAMEHAEFTVDGQAVSAERAHAIAANRVASVKVEHLTPTRARISITTGAPRDGESAPEVHMRHVPPTADSVSMQSMKRVHVSEMRRTFTGLVLMDGVKVDNGALVQLDPARIASMEVIKGAAATKLSSDPAAANGIIKVTTRRQD